MGTAIPGRGCARRAPAQGVAARRASGKSVAERSRSAGPSRPAQARYRADGLRSSRRGAAGRRARRPTRRNHGASGPCRRLARAVSRPWRRRGHGLWRDAHERGQDPRDRGHRCEPISAVVRRGPGEGEARGRSAGQAGERAQALSQPGRHRDRRTDALRCLAKGRRRQRDRRRRGANRRSDRQPLRRPPLRGRRGRERPRAGICRNSWTRWTN